MSLDSFCRIMDDLIQLGGLENIILSGMGDPSLNKQLPEMVRFAHKHNVGVTIITNLLAVDLDNILSSPGDLNLLVSICGVSHQSWTYPSRCSERTTCAICASPTRPRT